MGTQKIRPADGRQVAGQHAAEVVDRQRIEFDAIGVPGVDHAQFVGPAGRCGDHRSDTFTCQPIQGEPDGIGTLVVEPLQIVDAEQKRMVGTEPAQDLERAATAVEGWQRRPALREIVARVAA